MRERVLVAMSGGVDSSVAAALLVREGYEVLGATLQLHPCEDRQLGRSCCGVDAVLSARKVADQLGIPHTLIDCRREFEQTVLRPAWDDYARGRTPSPCVLCNQHIKFGFLLERARRLGATRLATGHYARVEADPDGHLFLARGRDPSKDQTYFLFSLSQEQLAASVFPLAERNKADVRALAKELGLAPADRTDSQDACLGTAEEGFAEAIRRRFDAEERPGDFVSPDGEVLGRHRGLHRYTVGQRRGLGVALGTRAFVCELDAETSRITLSTDERELLSEGLVLRLAPQLDPTRIPERVQVQIRSRHRAAPATVVERQDGRALVRFDAPQRAVTPGQAGVLYHGDRVVGGGWIESRRARWSRW